MKSLKHIKVFELFRINESKVVNFDNTNGNFVVMAGGPGAGKSFASDNLINLHNFKYFNVDNFRIFLAKKWWGTEWQERISTEKGYNDILRLSHTTSDPRNRTIKFLKQFLQVERNELGNVLFDAGGGQIDVIHTLHSLAKEAGYDTTIVYVDTDEHIALIRNQARERSLSDEMVLDYRDRVEAGKPELIELFDNAWIVNNSGLYDYHNRPDIAEKIK